MKRIGLRKIILYISARLVGAAVCVLIIFAGILIFIIDIFCQMINEIIKLGDSS